MNRDQLAVEDLLQQLELVLQGTRHVEEILDALREKLKEQK